MNEEFLYQFVYRRWINNERNQGRGLQFRKLKKKKFHYSKTLNIDFIFFTKDTE